MKKTAANTKSTKPTRASRTSTNNTKTTSSSTRKSTVGNRTDTSARTSQNGQPEQRNTSKLEKLFVTLLQEIYWAEKNSTNVIATMQRQATTEGLHDAFEDHMYVTHKHITRLEKVFAMLGYELKEKKCLAMAALAAEAEQIIAETEDGTMTRDAALIIAAQKVEHYEIATYGSLVQLALTLGHENAALLLEKTLWEEEQTDVLLTEIAECEVNPLADHEPVVAMEIEEVEYEMEA